MPFTLNIKYEDFGVHLQFNAIGEVSGVQSCKVYIIWVLLKKWNIYEQINFLRDWSSMPYWSSILASPEYQCEPAGLSFNSRDIHPL